ncbi:MAG TPA: hypothetical protein VE093_05455, partial [Polyangiaceae bacterium]|nr:hypothetical protein [Polyangiaceae bacterium]
AAPAPIDLKGAHLRRHASLLRLAKNLPLDVAQANKNPAERTRQRAAILIQPTLMIETTAPRHLPKRWPPTPKHLPSQGEQHDTDGDPSTTSGNS